MISTYTNGFNMTYMYGISRNDFINICKELGCIPEGITNGGLKFIDSNGRYKSMRLYINNFPFINEKTIMTDWENDNTLLVLPGTKSKTFLKSFNGALIWTMKELRICKDIFFNYGIICSNMPKQKNLSILL
jgi:hypothetical protein